MIKTTYLNSNIFEPTYREKVEKFGKQFELLARANNSNAILRDYGFHSFCPVCIKDEIAEILKLPLNSYWSAAEIGEIIATNGHVFALSIWDTYVVDSCHTYLPDGKLLKLEMKHYRNNIENAQVLSIIDSTFGVISSTWYIKKCMYVCDE